MMVVEEMEIPELDGVESTGIRFMASRLHPNRGSVAPCDI